MSDHTTPNKSFWTPANIITAVILAIGLVLTFKRFTMGIGSVTTNALAISLAARAAQRRRSTPCSGERIMGDPIGLRMQRCRLSGSPQTRATPTPRSSKPSPSTCSDADSSPPSTCPEATRVRTWRASSGK